MELRADRLLVGGGIVVVILCTAWAVTRKRPAARIAWLLLGVVLFVLLEFAGCRVVLEGIGRATGG
jgi:hypothetical protein